MNIFVLNTQLKSSRPLKRSIRRYMFCAFRQLIWPIDLRFALHQLFHYVEHLAYSLITAALFLYKPYQPSDISADSVLRSVDSESSYIRLIPNGRTYLIFKSKKYVMLEVNFSELYIDFTRQLLFVIKLEIPL